MKIGFTERGDGGRDLSWVNACKTGKVDGVIVVTKTITNSCGKAILELNQAGFPLILHATVTGWGGTPMEPGVYTPDIQLDAVQALIQQGFPAERVVIRVDPIIPTHEGLDRASKVILAAHRKGLLEKGRCRISVLDEYQHTKRRMQKRGYQPNYTGFYASQDQFGKVAEMLNWLGETCNVIFETCAEPALAAAVRPEYIQQCGCLSMTDMALMGLQNSERMAINGQNRNGCLCLSCKTELLQKRHPCQNQCAYCYWKD